MEKDTEKQILEELRNINQSIQNVNSKEKESYPTVYDIIRSLLIGILIVGPAIAVVIGVFQLLGSWILN
ncbi:hypothetical protein [Halobacillus sp. A5]|uniref:hypothetical protein n=1 Tax=Halobacillus sp. A5 TaxID=2880263 RepID=UPI0020A6357E|nr:hypothetical protein [Halobacillus sp. A5]MCP3027083.1 hypothetical protein [Halobacillus sp. A5]